VSGTAQTIRIRGASSIELSNEPLIFIDGVRANSRNDQIFGVGGQRGSRLNDIPPEDIESIEIVKGPAAATLYGADASAGVIQIITKKGRAGGGFSQSLTVEYNSIEPDFTPDANWGACGASHVTLQGNPCFGQAVGTIVSDNPLERYGAFDTGNLRSIAWSGRGGGEQYNYYVSLNSDDEQGTLPSNEYDRKGGQFNFDFLPRPNVRLEGGLGITMVSLDLPRNDNDIYGFLGGGLLGSPLTIGTSRDGWYAQNRQVNALQAYQNENETLRLRPRLSANYSPRDWFTNRLTLGGDFSRSEAASFFPRNDSTWYGNVDLNSGQIAEARRNFDLLTFDYLGNVTARITDALRSDFSFGTQYIYERDDLTNVTGVGLLTNAARSVNASARVSGGGQSYEEEKSIGVFGQAQLAFQDRLYLTLAGRWDRHSAFGSDFGTFFSPKVGISYVLSDEPSINLPDFFSTVRLRGTFGTTGRSPASGALRTFGPEAYLLSGAVFSGVIPADPGNPDLKPERGEEIEAGLDVGMLNERVGLELTYFKKSSKDLILEQPLAPSLGFDEDPLVNIGELENSGFEVAANAQLLSRQNFGWEARVALNTLHNEVTDLGEVAPFGQLNRVTPGRPAFSFHSRKIREYVIDADPTKSHAIVSDTVEFFGNLLPDFEGTASSILTLFKYVRLYGQLDWKSNFYIYNNTDQFRERQFGTGERWVRRNEILTEQERLQRFGPFVTESGSPIAAGNVNEAYVEPGDFVRLREVSVTFSLPQEWASRMRTDGMSVTLAGRNLALWTDYTGVDPEINSATSGQTRSEFLTVPQPRRWVARVNLQF
jgi:TonB-dependent SusC/RagA subfamily outer membrane receptor